MNTESKVTKLCSETDTENMSDATESRGQGDPGTYLYLIRVCFEYLLWNENVL